MDIAAPTGTPVLAGGAGTVIDAGDYFFNGQTAIVDHGRGFLALNRHLSMINASVGASLESDALLGRVGATGCA